MAVSDVVQLIGAVTGVLGAVGLAVSPIIVAIINRKAKQAEKVTQGQPVDHLGILISDLARERDFQRRRAEEAEQRLHAANRSLAAADLPTH